MFGGMHMYNENDEMFVVSDMDEDIKKRKELIEQAKNIEADKSWNEIFKEITDLRKQWRRISTWESAYEDTLTEEFEGYLDKLYSKRNELFQNVSTVKEELISRAKEISKSNDFKKATEEMNELMNQWKQAGTTKKEVDDKLWEEFNSARQEFFDRKHEYWKNLQDKFSSALEVKKDLIEKAKELADSKEWQKTSVKFKELMDEWKSAGSAGREHEDDLWNEFNEHRQQFYHARNVYYDELHEKQNENYLEKSKLVEQAKAIVESNDHSRENTNKMKELSNAWKQIGSCRREKEDAIWKSFREQMDIYFDGLREMNEQKHQEWKQRMMNARARKDELLQEQKRQIKRLQSDMANVLGERALAEIEEQIEDKKQFIKKLEEQIEDIDKSLE